MQSASSSGRGRPRGSAVARGRPYMGPGSHPYHAPNSQTASGASGSVPSRLPLLGDGAYYGAELRSRTREESLRLFAGSLSNVDEFLVSVSELSSDRQRAAGLWTGRVSAGQAAGQAGVPLSDTRLLGLDTEDFPVFNAAVRPEQLSQYFLGVGWDNVQTVLSLRAALPALSKLDAILGNYRAASASVPLTMLGGSGSGSGSGVQRRGGGPVPPTDQFGVVVSALVVVQFVLLGPDGDQQFSRDGLAAGEAGWVGKFVFSEEGEKELVGGVKILMHNQVTDVENLATSRVVIQLDGSEIFPSVGLALHEHEHSPSGASAGTAVGTEFKFLAATASPYFNLGKKAVDCDVEVRLNSSKPKQMSMEIKPSSSSECKFGITGELELVDVRNTNRKVSLYVFLGNLLTMAQFKAVVNQVDSIDVNNLGVRISPYSVIIQMTMDVFEAIFNMMLGLIGRYMFSTLAMLAFFKFVLFSILESRLLIFTVRARLLGTANEGGEVADLSVAVRQYYGKFHVFILSLTVWLLMIPGSFKYILLVLQLYWVPQIVFSAATGQKPSLNLLYIAVMTLTRLYTPLYLYADTGNFLDGQLYPTVEPSFWYVAVVVILALLQVAVLTLQKLWSPRWFVPLIFLPHVYNYYRSVPTSATATDLEQGDASVECVICMTELHPANKLPSASTSAGDRPAVTPCSHVFHASCLADWLEVKLECPTCRRPLPPMTY